MLYTYIPFCYVCVVLGAVFYFIYFCQFTDLALGFLSVGLIAGCAELFRQAFQKKFSYEVKLNRLDVIRRFVLAFFDLNNRYFLF